MSLEIVPICYDCNIELTKRDKLENEYYRLVFGLILCFDCSKLRERQLIKEISECSSRDLDIYI